MGNSKVEPTAYMTDADNAWGNSLSTDVASAAVDAAYVMGLSTDYYARVHGRWECCTMVDIAITEPAFAVASQHICGRHLGAAAMPALLHPTKVNLATAQSAFNFVCCLGANVLSASILQERRRRQGERRQVTCPL